MSYNTVRELIPKYSKPSSCQGCPIYSIGEGFSIPDGSGLNKVLVVGEALGAHEAKDGLAFRPHADAGSVLERAFREIGVPRQQFVLFNIIACRPPNNELSGAPYEQEAIAHCSRHLKAVFDRFKPEVIVALGAVAFRTLTGLTGERQSLSDLRGYPIPTQSTQFAYLNDDGTYYHPPVIGSFHPSYIMRGQWNMFPVLKRDLRFAIKCAKDGYPDQEVDYNENPGRQDLIKLRDKLLADPSLPCSVDWETVNLVDPPKKRKWQNEIINQVNLSIRAKTGLALVNWEQHKDILNEILGTPNTKIGHNIWGFDLLVGKNNGLYIDGPIDDTMEMFHWMFPDLPGSEGKKAEDEEAEGVLAPLQFVCSFYDIPFPWKSTSESRPQHYGCADADFTLRAWEGLIKDLKLLGIYEGYLRLNAELMPCLINMAARGIPMNRKKLEIFNLELQEKKMEILATAQLHIESNCPQLMPTKQRTGLKGNPRILKQIEKIDKEIAKGNRISIGEVDPEEMAELEEQRNSLIDEMEGAGWVQRSFFVEAHRIKCPCFKLRKNFEKYEHVPNAQVIKGRLYTPEPGCFHCEGEGFYIEPGNDEMRWCQMLEFNLMSSDQMREYALTMGHKIPASSKTKGKKRGDKPKKPSMEQEVVEKMVKTTKDPLYRLSVDYRKLDKLEGTYVAGWMPGPDERVHTQFLTAPATGQLSSTKPNVQNALNISKQGEMAVRFNECIEADSDKVLLEFDYRSFHAQTLGIMAKDASYIRLAKMDIHSYLASYLLKLPHRDEALSWPDDQLRDWLKWIKKNHERTRNKQAKPAILGYGFCLGGARLYAQNEESFNNEKEAIAVFDMLDKIFYITANFRNTIPLVAKKQGGFLKSAYDCIRWFFDIQRPDFRTGQMVRGGDWEKAVAYLPANCAFGMIKRAMTFLEFEGLAEKYGLINQVHDALKFHCLKKYSEEALSVVQEIMQRPSEVLFMPDGSPFWVEVEKKVGSNWADMEEVH